MTPLNDDDPRHGSNAGHQAHIRYGPPPCDPCMEARRAYALAWRSRYYGSVPRGPNASHPRPWTQRRPLTPDDPRHGTINGYNAHLREGEPACDPCVIARRAYMKRWRDSHRVNRMTKTDPKKDRKLQDHILAAGQLLREENRGEWIPNVMSEWAMQSMQDILRRREQEHRDAQNDAAKENKP